MIGRVYTHTTRLNKNERQRKMRVRKRFDHLFCMHASICLYISCPQEKYASKVITQPMIMLTARCGYQLVIDAQLVLSAWYSTVGQELYTCSSSQLQRGLCVVLHPVLQGPLHVGFGIQQQLQRLGGDTEEHDGRERGRQREEKIRRSITLAYLSVKYKATAAVSLA